MSIERRNSFSASGCASALIASSKPRLLREGSLPSPEREVAGVTVSRIERAQAIRLKRAERRRRISAADLLIGCCRSLTGSSGGVVWSSGGIGPVSARAARPRGKRGAYGTRILNLIHSTRRCRRTSGRDLINMNGNDHLASLKR
jgi:hypothetical protein